MIEINQPAVPEVIEIEPITTPVTRGFATKNNIVIPDMVVQTWRGKDWKKPVERQGLSRPIIRSAKSGLKTRVFSSFI